MDHNETITEFTLKRKDGPLSDIHISIKDNIAVQGQRMTCASKMLEKYIAPYSATVVERLLDAGATIRGKVNMDEFACGSFGESSAFGVTKNPIDPQRVPGGSSSGSAVSVALGKCDASLGSDTGGSVRCPAAYCNLVAFKPTYGTISRYGLADMAMSLETIAPIAKDVKTLARVLDAIAGKDDRDCATHDNKKIFVESLSKKMSNVTVGILPALKAEKDVQEAFDDAIALLKKKGIQAKEISLPSLKYAIPAYYITMYAEFASAMQKYDGYKYGHHGFLKTLFGTMMENRSCFGKEVKRRIILGTYVTLQEYESKWYTQAIKARRLITKEFESAFEDVDFILTPTMPSLPPKIGEVQEPLTMYLADIFTVSANLVGIPAGSVPIGNMIGLQIMGRKHDDENVLQLMNYVEEMYAK